MIFIIVLFIQNLLILKFFLIISSEVKKESQNINLDIGGKIAEIGAGIKKDLTIGESNGRNSKTK